MGPLSPYRILDLTSERGAFCTRLLADLGADVIKIEPREGDPTRRLGPYVDDVPGPERSLRFASLNANKKGVTLDLETPGGRHLFLALLPTADALVEDRDPGDLDRLGLTDAALRQVNPALVHTSITGFGLTGPRRSYQAPDIVALAMGGILGISGDPERPPCTGPESQAFYIAGMHATFGTVLALFARPALGGQGQLVDISVQDCVATEEHQVIRFSLDGHIVRREGNQHGSAAPGKGFRAKDGWVHLYITHGWPRFVEWLGNPDALSGEAWQDGRFRRANVDVLDLFVKPCLEDLTRQEIVRGCQERHLAVVPLNSPSEAAEDPHLRALGLFQDARQMRFVGPPWWFSRTPVGIHRGPPALGQDNEDIPSFGRRRNATGHPE